MKFGIWIRKGRVRGGIGLGFGIKIWNLDQKGRVRGGIGFGRHLVIVELHPPMSYDTIPPISEKETLLSTFCS